MQTLLRSFEFQLIETIDALARNINRCKEIDVVIMDFRKTVDIFPYRRLLAKA